MLSSLYNDLKKRMQGAIDNLNKTLRGLRTGRASTAMLDPIRIDYYGTPTPLNQVASVNVPEHNLIVVQPWDASVLSEIERAINKANIGLVPSNDGKLIRLVVPPMTEERRKEVVKTMKKYCEECRIAIRNIRRDGNEEVKLYEKEKEISEDMAYKAQSEIQKITEQFITDVDKIMKDKEAEILNF